MLQFIAILFLHSMDAKQIETFFVVVVCWPPRLEM